MSEKQIIELERGPVARYLFASTVLMILLAGSLLFGAGLVLAPLYMLWPGRRIHARQADALRYHLEGRTLRIEEGVWFLKRKAIPLDRITDLVLYQGPLMRRCGIWGLQVQTSGQGHAYPEARMLGLRDPMGVREAILAARERDSS